MFNFCVTKMENELLKSWKSLNKGINLLTEEELKNFINYEIATTGRKAILTRLYQRYDKLRGKREMELVLAKEIIL